MRVNRSWLEDKLIAKLCFSIVIGDMLNKYKVPLDKLDSKHIYI